MQWINIGRIFDHIMGGWMDMVIHEVFDHIMDGFGGI